MYSSRRSFKSHGSHRRSIPRTTFPDQFILLSRSDDEDRAADADSLHAGDVVVKVEDVSAPNNVSNAVTYRNGDAQKEEQTSQNCNDRGNDNSSSSRGEFTLRKIPAAIVPQIDEDPPSRITSRLIHSQRSAAESELAINMNLKIEELKSQTTSTSLPRDVDPSLPPRPPHPRRNSTSSSSSDNDYRNEEDRRGMTASVGAGSKKEADGVVPEMDRCTSYAAFQRNPPLLQAKTRSRMMDPLPIKVVAPVPNEDAKRSGKIQKSGQLRSGLLNSGLLAQSQISEDDDEDPFADNDIPRELKRAKPSWFTFLEWLSFILILSALICSLAIARLRKVTLWELHLWKWSLLVLALICGRLVSGWIIRLTVFLIELNFVMRKRVLYFVYGVRTAVQNVIWLGLVLLSWFYLFDKEVQRESDNKALPYVTKMLLCLTVSTLIQLLKTLSIKVLASYFHVSTYFDRIQEAVFNQYVIETLSSPPVVEIPETQEEEEKDRIMAEMQNLRSAGVTIPNDLNAATLQRSEQNRRSIKLSGSLSRKDGIKRQDEGGGITIEMLRKLNQKNVSAWNMKRMMKVVRYGRLTTLDEQIRKGYVDDDESPMRIRSELEAKAAAKKIFQNVASPGSSKNASELYEFIYNRADYNNTIRKDLVKAMEIQITPHARTDSTMHADSNVRFVRYIYLIDLMRFMREDDAVKAMSLFEGAQENNRISRKSFKNWMVNSFTDRRALSLTLNDTKTVVNALHRIVNAVVGLVIIMIWVLILGIATTQFFVLLISQILLAMFVFGNTLKTAFEALIFLFVMHPFDVGDSCEIDGSKVVVEEMNVMTTVFLRSDSQKMTYPNSVLANKPIGNFYRSPDAGDAIDICVHVATPLEKLTVMRDRILKFMDDKKEHWYEEDSAIVLRDVDDTNRLKISIWMRHRANFQDSQVRQQRRELVLQEIIKVLRELDIEYRTLPLDVNIQSMPSVISSRVPSNWTAFN